MKRDYPIYTTDADLSEKRDIEEAPDPAISSPTFDDPVILPYRTAADFRAETGYAGVHSKGKGVYDPAALKVEEGGEWGKMPDLTDEFVDTGAVRGEMPQLSERLDDPSVDSISRRGREKTGHTAEEWGGPS